MHELLLTGQDLRKENLLAMASKAGLEPNAFQQCLTSERASSEVLRDLEEGNKSGVQGTPALFLDGQPIELPDNPADLGKRLTQSIRKIEQSAAANKDEEYAK
jgi:protein-disulfide isomerase